VQEIPLVMLLQVIDSSGVFFLVATNASNDQLSLHILRWGWGNPNSKKNDCTFCKNLQVMICGLFHIVDL
jgi:hypothetical protein